MYIMKWANLEEQDSLMQERVNCGPLKMCAAHDRVEFLVLEWEGHQIPKINTRFTYIA
jgi:hypothetical protein